MVQRCLLTVVVVWSACVSLAAAVHSQSLEESSVSPELATARNLASTWGIGEKFSFLSVENAERSSEEVLSATGAGSMIVALLGDQKPHRRNISIGEPFLQLTGPGLLKWESAPASQLLFIDRINSAAEVLEAYLGRQLFPFRLVVQNGSQTTFPNGRTLAVWDTSSGTVHLNPRVLEAVAKLTTGARQAVDDFTESLFQQIGEHSLQTGKGWMLVLKAAAPLAVVVALAAKIPVWFCIACPVVLGLLAPFLLNAGLGATAELICQHYSLPTEDCNDLWFGAFGLALVLSLASVFPIVAICQLRQCARQG